MTHKTSVLIEQFQTYVQVPEVVVGEVHVVPRVVDINQITKGMLTFIHMYCKLLNM